MVKKTLIRPNFWGVALGGGRLTSHKQFHDQSIFEPTAAQAVDCLKVQYTDLFSRRRMENGRLDKHVVRDFVLF